MKVDQNKALKNEFYVDNLTKREIDVYICILLCNLAFEPWYLMRLRILHIGSYFCIDASNEV